MARKYNKYKNLGLYKQMYTCKVLQISGVYVNLLYLLKETKDFLISIETWAFCAHTFKQKKNDIKPPFDIPVVKDKDTVEFLNTIAWKDYENNGVDGVETVSFLKKLFPDKNIYYIFELDSFLSTYAWGVFNKNTQWYKEDRIKYLKIKYRYDLPIDVPNDLISSDKRDEYINYVDNHIDLEKIFKTIGENLVVCPYIFPEEILKCFDGEINFVVTDDAVFYDIHRCI